MANLKFGYEIDLSMPIGENARESVAYNLTLFIAYIFSSPGENKFEKGTSIFHLPQTQWQRFSGLLNAGLLNAD